LPVRDGAQPRAAGPLDPFDPAQPAAPLHHRGEAPRPAQAPALRARARTQAPERPEEIRAGGHPAVLPAHRSEREPQPLAELADRPSRGVEAAAGALVRVQPPGMRAVRLDGQPVAAHLRRTDADPLGLRRTAGEVRPPARPDDRPPPPAARE